MGVTVEPQDLNELRSSEELLSYQKDVRRRAEDLHAEFEGLPFPDEARDEFAGLMKQSEDIDRRVAELEARKSMIERNASEGRVERPEDVFARAPKASLKERDIYDLHTMRINPGDPDATRTEYRDRALRAIELAKFPGAEERKYNVNREDVQTHLENLISSTQQSVPGEVARRILTTGSPVYRSAFWKSVAQQPLSGEEQRALSIGVPAAAAGLAIPFTLDPTLIPTSNSVVNPARALARIVSISGSNTWNGVSSGAIAATRQVEAAAVTDASPTIVAPTATVTAARAWVPFSVELQEDWGALESEMAKLFADAKDDDEGAQFVTGVGTTVFPQGFVTGTTATSAAATGLTVTAANVYALEAALAPRFRNNEQFVANRGIWNVIRGIDTAGGAALWLYISQGLVTQSPTPGNTGATILGRGAWEASAMQATVVNATKIMIVGDFNYFLIVDRIGMNVELVPTVFGAAQGNLPTLQRGLLAYWRNTSKVLSASAFVAMTGTT
jgi:HK97 family phage major capsid protein